MASSSCSVSPISRRRLGSCPWLHASVMALYSNRCSAWTFSANFIHVETAASLVRPATSKFRRQLHTLDSASASDRALGQIDVHVGMASATRQPEGLQSHNNESFIHFKSESGYQGGMRVVFAWAICFCFSLFLAFHWPVEWRTEAYSLCFSFLKVEVCFLYKDFSKLQLRNKIFTDWVCFCRAMASMDLHGISGMLDK